MNALRIKGVRQLSPLKAEEGQQQAITLQALIHWEFMMIAWFKQGRPVALQLLEIWLTCCCPQYAVLRDDYRLALDSSDNRRTEALAFVKTNPFGCYATLHQQQ